VLSTYIIMKLIFLLLPLKSMLLLIGYISFELTYEELSLDQNVALGSTFLLIE